ncbi:Retroelement pol Polyprotein [Phytophthora megakarya]|uniref:Retroelement pol Polyprotein n=1 Tax=Phytophthora megakarya TaxID=4795 RepID=A0A225US73_9STRA|nr:Retroelement pol Polyprotein [Phytophthora megakarya]
MTYDYDGILGRPWLEQRNPLIDWADQQISFPEAADRPDNAPQVIPELAEASVSEATFQEFRRCLLAGECAEVYRVDIAATPRRRTTPAVIRVLIDEFSDVLPDSLPDVLPEREADHEVTLRPDAIPAARAPFRHLPAERETLSNYVEDLLRKEWIEQSHSLWTSMIFAMPKMDPVTGASVLKVDWIRNGDIAHLVR